VLQALAVNAGQVQARNVDEERGVLGHQKTFNRIYYYTFNSCLRNKDGG